MFHSYLIPYMVDGNVFYMHVCDAVWDRTASKCTLSLSVQSLIYCPKL